MSIRYMFVDVDGTLVSGPYGIGEKTLKAIAKAREQGIKVVLSSGRAPCVMKDLYEQMGVPKCKDEYMITSNGSLIVDTELNEILAEPMAKEDVKKALHYLYESEIEVPTFASAKAYYPIIRNASIINKTAELGSNIEISIDQVDEIVDREDIYKLLITFEDRAYGQKIHDDIMAMTEDRILCIFSMKTLIDGTRNGFSKGTAVEYLCKKTGVSIKDTVSIGDNFNDTAMMVLDNYKACPANAEDDIKALCDYISPYDCAHDAVGDIIENFILKIK